jgi:hypothetical protein
MKYEAPELLQVGAVSGLVLGAKTSLIPDNPSGDYNFPQSVLDVD